MAPFRLQPTIAAQRALWGVAGASALALVAGAPLAGVSAVAGSVLAGGLVAAAADVVLAWRGWQQATPRVERQLPAAMALGVPARVRLRIRNPGPVARTLDVFDEAGEGLEVSGLPREVTVEADGAVDLAYTATPHRRGMVRFGAVQLRWRSTTRALQLITRAGEPAQLRVYPDFAAVARYAWLAGDQRLAQIGIKTYTQRGSGTDFRQLRDYRIGDSLRHVDWKVTLRQGKPVVREYQDERDQRVLLLLDAGRRMRADEGGTGLGSSHFDQALNALMLLAYVALKQGDEVGAMTFGVPREQVRHFAARKGVHTLNALMNQLHDVEPGLGHPDYEQLARDVLVRQPRRSLVIVLTNFRDEDAGELEPALRLLRRRHLVVVASLREQVLRQVAEQPLASAPQAVEVAAAHLLRQSRADAFRRAVGDDALSLDVEPARLATELVNRYHLVKRAGLL